jgi:hypothetical protein
MNKYRLEMSMIFFDMCIRNTHDFLPYDREIDQHIRGTLKEGRYVKQIS